MKFSIITVCFNAEKGIEKTVDSILQQKYEDYEYIVIDGCSDDNTLAILENYSHIEKLNLYSEKDFGIYNAMNRGISRARGEYVLFVNAGDELYSENTLQNISEFISGQEKIIYYGNVQLQDVRGEIRESNFEGVEGSTLEKVMLGGWPCHQAIIAPLQSLREHYFSEKYKIRADFEWFVYCISSDYRCKHIPITVSKYLTDGISSSVANQLVLSEETNDIIKRYKEKLSLQVGSEIENQDLIENLRVKIAKIDGLFTFTTRWLTMKQSDICLAEWFEQKHINKIAVYGMGKLGKRLVQELKGTSVNIQYVIDQSVDEIHAEFPVFSSETKYFPDGVDLVVVTAIADYHEIERRIKEKVKAKVISLELILTESGF